MSRVGISMVRKDQILSAAALVVAQRGFERATLRDVAGVAGVSTGLVNHYFTNREDLLTQTLVFVSERNLTRMRDAVSRSASDIDRLRTLVRSSVGPDSDSSDVGSRVWISALSHSLQSKAMARVIRDRRVLFQSLIRDVLRPLVEARADEMSLDALAAEVDAYLHGISIHTATGEEQLDAAAIEQTFVRLIQGVRSDFDAAGKRGPGWGQ